MLCKWLFLLYCLGDNDKNKNTYLLSTDVIFFLNIFHLWLVESIDAECTNMEG